MTEYTLTLPKPRSVVLAFGQDGLPGVATVNAALADIEPKIVFRWHLSVLVEAEGVVPEALPHVLEQAAILDIQAQLAPLVEANGQALWLARIVHNSTWELLWRVHDVRQVQSALNGLIASGSYLRPFSYKLQDDPTWELALDYLNQSRSLR